ncbi:MAG: shikimate dehydrogenase [Azospirillaceae bacterium]|nr:shikimate dehydrogenase [Azospirillaceae bacterium]
MRPTGKARVAGVIGWPVAHSRSPRVHGYWLDLYGIDGAYVPLAVPPQRLGDAIRGLAALGFRGANVTVPHKQAVMPFLDVIEAAAQRIGAVNTIVVGDNGLLTGTNTDGFGFLANLRAACPGWRAADGPAVVIGAGGAARAVVVSLLDAGVPSVRLINRTDARAHDLAGALGGAPGTAIEVVAWDQRAAALGDAGLLVNTTTQGMEGHAALDLVLDDLPGAATVTDIVYTPLETPLLAAARARGNPVVDGLGMLLHQARPGFQAWFGRLPEVTPALRDVVLAPG